MSATPMLDGPLVVRVGESYLERARRAAPASARRHRIAALTVVALLTVYAIVYPLVVDAAVDLEAASQAPSLHHPFGTTNMGMDVAAAVAVGLRTSALLGIGAAALSTLVGVLAALAAVFGGRRVDAVITRAIDMMCALPHLVVGIVIVAFLRPSLTAVLLSIALTHWTTPARVLRADLRTALEAPHVDAAISLGATRRHVFTAHLLPAIAGQVGVVAALSIPHAVFHESTLSFLGLGTPPHIPTLGVLLARAPEAIIGGQWWAALFPGVALAVFALAVAAALPTADGIDHD